MFLPCSSCKAELSAALVGADGRCPFCGTKAVGAAPDPIAPAARPRAVEADRPAPPRPSAPPDGDTVSAPRASGTPRPENPLPRGWGGLEVGSRGILFGKPAHVTGRVRFDVDRPRTISWWDAWAIRFGDGSEGWLFDREGALAILRPHTVRNAVAFEELAEGRLVRPDAGPPATVVDLGTATVRGTEGRAPELSRGATVRYATLAGDAWRYHLQWTDGGPVGCWRGQVVTPAMLAAGFGLRAPSGLKESASASLEGIGQLPLSLQVALLLLAIPVLAGLAFMLLFDRIGALFR